MAENYPSRGFESSIGSGVHFGVGNHSKIDSLIIIGPMVVKLLNSIYLRIEYTYSEPDE